MNIIATIHQHLSETIPRHYTITVFSSTIIIRHYQYNVPLRIQDTTKPNLYIDLNPNNHLHIWRYVTSSSNTDTIIIDLNEPNSLEQLTQLIVKYYDLV